MPRQYRTENLVIADHNDWLEIDVSTAKFPDARMKIDKDYWDAIKSALPHRIYAMKTSRTGAFAATTMGGRTTFIHSLIMGFEKGGVTIKHINYDRLDNRRANLRRVIPR